MKKLILFCIFLFAFVLRFFRLGQNPPSLYWDEASLGYNGYTIATSLKDEHGEFLPLDRFIAFGDYKPPGYIYAAAFSIKIFGLNEFSVRLPSAIAGFLMVVFSYLLTKEWFQKKKISLIAALFIAVSPWSIHFSRAAFEAYLAAFFNLAAVYFFVTSRRKKWLLFVSTLFFILSFYTFNANRIIAPLLLLSLSIIYFKNIKENLKWVIISVFIGSFMVLPSIGFLQSPQSKIRLQEVSILNNLIPLKESNSRIAFDGNTWWAKLIHNRRISYGFDYLKHYFDNFSGRFLFTHGDVNPRLNIQEMGELYIVELPYLMIGVYILFKKREKALVPILAWMAIVPIPAGFAKETPHALRIISILPTYQIIAAYGLYQFISYFNLRVLPLTYPKLRSKLGFASNSVESSFGNPSLVSPVVKRNVLLFVICSLFSVSLYYFLHNYFVHFPVRWSGEWQYGYKEMVQYILQNEKKYDSVFVTQTQGRPYIYFAFYNKYPVNEFIEDKIETTDSFGFYDVKKLGHISFESFDIRDAYGKILYVGSRGDTPPGFQTIKTVKNLAGEVVYVISHKI